jgi:hypothetical protein
MNLVTRYGSIGDGCRTMDDVITGFLAESKGF